MNIRMLAALCFSAVATGCASSSADIQPAYVSPMQYQDYDCQQLSAEAQRVSHRAAVVAGQQDDKHSSDAAWTTVGAIIFWPALFALDGDGATASELASLKGQMQAIEQASIQKKCGIEFQIASASAS